MQLSPEQSAAVHAVEPTVVVAATAGSGKTRVLVERIKHLVGCGICAEHICVVTFTSAAAHEIQERLSPPAMRGAVTHEARVVCYNLQPPSPRLGYCGTLHGLLLRAIRAVPHLCGYSAAPTVANDELSDELWLEAITETRCRESMKSLRACASAPLPVDRALNKVESCAAHYCQKLVEAGLVDYDGILRLGLSLLQNRQWPFTFTHLLVDEVQDSGKMDALIYDAFPADQKFFVGDEDQSIYGFRGGDPAYLRSLALQNGFKRLEECYRCSQEICDAAQNVVRAVPFRLQKGTFSVHGSRFPVQVTRFASYPAEVASIAMSIAQHAADGSAPLNQVAVLLRSNALVDIFRDGLKAHGIQLAERSGGALPEDWSKAQSIVALCAEPDNDRLALNYIQLRDGDVEAKRVRLESAKAMGSVNEFSKIVSKLSRESLDYALILMAKVNVAVATMEAVERLASEISGHSLSDLAVSMLREMPESQAMDGVHVGTMHSAKGREWNDVYLPAFEQGVIPAKRDVNEERRLCFVAFTRARNRLHISHCAERPNSFGSRRIEPAVPSQFIQEAGL